MARRYGYRYGRRGGGHNAGSGVLLLVIILAVVAAKHPVYGIAVAFPVAAVLVAYYWRRAYKKRKARRELEQAVEDRRHFWRIAQIVPGSYSVYLTSVPDKDVDAVRDCLENLDQNPAIDLDVE